MGMWLSSQVDEQQTNPRLMNMIKCFCPHQINNVPILWADSVPCSSHKCNSCHKRAQNDHQKQHGHHLEGCLECVASNRWRSGPLFHLTTQQPFLLAFLRLHIWTTLNRDRYLCSKHSHTDTEYWHWENNGGVLSWSSVYSWIEQCGC